MNQEKFVNQYIELLNATITEAIQKNLVLQAQKKIIENDLDEVREAVKNYEDSVKKIQTEKDNELVNLKQQLNDSRRETIVVGNEREELKKSIQHVDTFKNELVKTRSEIEKLNTLLSKKDKEIKNLSAAILEKEQLIEAMLEEKNKPADVGNTWIKKAPSKKKLVKEETIKDAGKF